MIDTLSIKVGSRELDLGAGAVSLQKSSPIMDRSRIPGIRNLSFKIPATKNNRLALGFWDQLHAFSYPVEVDCQLLLNSNLFIRGKLLITAASEQGGWIEIRLRDNLVKFANDYGSKTIKEYTHPTISWPRTSKASLELQWSGTLVNGKIYSITLNDVLHEYTVGPSDGAQEVADGLRDLINANFPGYASSSASAELTVAQPTVNDPFIIGWTPNTASDLNFTLIDYSSQADAHTADLAAHIADVRANPANHDHAFPAMGCPDLYGDKNAVFEGVANCYASGSWVANTNQSFESNWERALIPCFKMKYVLDLIFDDAQVNVVDNPEGLFAKLAEMLWWNTYSIDETIREYSEVNQQFYWHNVFSETIEPTNHLPEITVADLLKGLGLFFNVIWDFDLNDQTITIRNVEDIFTTNEASHLQLTNLGAVSYPERKGITFQQHEEKDERTYLYANPLTTEYVHGLGKDTWSCALGTLLMKEIFIYNDTRARVPLFDLPGSSPILEFFNEFGPRVIWLRGEDEDKDGGNYVYASSDHLDSDEVAISGETSLHWSDGGYGLIDQYYTNFLHFLDTYKEVDAEVILEHLDPADLDFFKPIRFANATFILLDYNVRLPNFRPQPLKLAKL